MTAVWFSATLMPALGPPPLEPITGASLTAVTVVPIVARLELIGELPPGLEASNVALLDPLVNPPA